MENLILVIVIALIGLVKWIIENRGKFSQSKDDRREFERPPIRREETSRPARGAETPEEERMRRFMEALGLPAENTPPPASRRAPRPQATPTPPPETIPPPVARPEPPVITPPHRMPGETGRWGNHPAPPKEKSQPKPAPAPRPATIPAPRPVGSPVAMPTPKPITAGAAPFQPLDAFPEIPDVAPTSSVAPPMEIASLEFKQATSNEPGTGLKTIDSLRGELRNPAALRRAFVLREILGPPLAMKP